MAPDKLGDPDCDPSSGAEPWPAVGGADGDATSTMASTLSGEIKGSWALNKRLQLLHQEGPTAKDDAVRLELNLGQQGEHQGFQEHELLHKMIVTLPKRCEAWARFDSHENLCHLYSWAWIRQAGNNKLMFLCAARE